MTKQNFKNSASSMLLPEVHTIHTKGSKEHTKGSDKSCRNKPFYSVTLKTATLTNHGHLLPTWRILTLHALSVGDCSSAHPMYPSPATSPSGGAVWRAVSVTLVFPRQGRMSRRSRPTRGRVSTSQDDNRPAAWLTSDSPGLRRCGRATTRLQAPSFHLQMWSASRTERGHYYRLGRESCCPSVVYPNSPGPHTPSWALAHN